eukprot:scpid91418/ scgid13368/ 
MAVVYCRLLFPVQALALLLLPLFSATPGVACEGDEGALVKTGNHVPEDDGLAVLLNSIENEDLVATTRTPMGRDREVDMVNMLSTNQQHTNQGDGDHGNDDDDEEDDVVTVDTPADGRTSCDFKLDLAQQRIEALEAAQAKAAEGAETANTATRLLNVKLKLVMQTLDQKTKKIRELQRLNTAQEKELSELQTDVYELCMENLAREPDPAMAEVGDADDGLLDGNGVCNKLLQYSIPATGQSEGKKTVADNGFDWKKVTDVLLS